MSSSNSSTSTEFESARGEEEDQEDNMGRGNADSDVFENSSCEDRDTEVEEMDVGGQQTDQASSSGSSKGHTNFTISDEHVRRVWTKLPAGLKEVLELATGMLYMERYESFISNNWPYDVKRGALCHPKALGMAGLGFYSLDPKPAAQCQVCLTILTNLQRNSNAWILHSEASPKCPLIKLGQRQEVDDYTIDQMLELAFAKILNLAKQEVKGKEDLIKRQLCAIRELEIKREREKEEKTSSKS